MGQRASTPQAPSRRSHRSKCRDRLGLPPAAGCLTALAGVLSAMREIILDRWELPPTVPERLTEYRRRFPSLSPAELDDLAAVPPEGWRTYTRSIFTGERNILRRYFQVTFALLERSWPAIEAEPFNPYHLVRAAHDARPWRDRTSRALAGCFLEYLTIDRTDITNRHPVIGDMARLENVAVGFRHAANSVVGPDRSLTVAALTERTVGDVMGLSLVVPHLVIGLRFGFDAPALRGFFYTHDRTLPNIIAPAPTTTVASRTIAGFTRWTTLTPTVFHLFETAERGRSIPLGDLAEHFAADHPTVTDERELFRRFLHLIGDLIEAGALAIESQPPISPR